MQMPTSEARNLINQIFAVAMRDRYRNQKRDVLAACQWALDELGKYDRPAITTKKDRIWLKFFQKRV